MSTEQERAAFEAWFTKTKAYISDSKDILAQIVRDIAWDTWKARAALQSQDQEDAERYRWLRDSYGLYDLPYEEDYGLGLKLLKFPTGSELDEVIDNARRIERDENG